MAKVKESRELVERVKTLLEKGVLNTVDGLQPDK